MSRTAGALLVLVALVSAVACSSSSKPSATPGSSSTTIVADHPAKAVVWPAPPDPMVRARTAGLVPEPAEQLAYHVHAHLDVFLNGRRVTVPSGLGINIHDPAVHVFPNYQGGTGYGGIDPPCKQPCISPLHTHDITGVIHTESATHKDNTLGQLFVEWGVRLDSKCVRTYCKPTIPIAVFVNGRLRPGDPRTIDLSNHEEIALVIGTPPTRIPSAADFSSV